MIPKLKFSIVIYLHKKNIQITGVFLFSRIELGHYQGSIPREETQHSQWDRDVSRDNRDNFVRPHR